jgi:hypothetical protein
MDDDSLIEYGAALENELSEIKQERLHLGDELAAELPRIRKSAIKLSINILVASLGRRDAADVWRLSGTYSSRDRNADMGWCRLRQGTFKIHDHSSAVAGA